MSTTTITKRGYITIPAEIRARHGLTPGMQVEVVDEGGVIRLLVRRKVAPSDPGAGFGMVKVAPRPADKTARRLSEFDAARIVGKNVLAR